MEIKVQNIVKSIQGRDKDKYYVVSNVEKGYLHVADGLTRKLNCPKHKNIKHVKLVEKTTAELTNQSICEILKKYKNGE